MERNHQTWTESNKPPTDPSKINPLTPFNIKRLEREGYEVSIEGWEKRKADIEFENFCGRG